MSVGIRQLQLMGVVVACVLLVVVGYNIKLANDVNKLEDEVSRTEAEIKRLEELIGEVNQFEAERQRLRKQLDVIRDLEKGKTGPVKALDTLATVIPKRVWIETMAQSGSTINLTGYGVENADISDFMNALEKSPMFTDIKLQVSEKVVQFGQPIYKFKLTTNVNYSKG
ncbi:MAG: PilN domain-containing protein [Deltaproteobacteria bacterium]|nr:PilN domain-containing protein [Deltaproteobacteria bacterium]